MVKSIAVVVLALASFWFLPGSARAKCPPGDLNGDCQVDVADLQILAKQWLMPPESIADLNGDQEVSVIDFAMLAAKWQQAGVPLVINEVMAANSSTIMDPQSEYDDWIEIHNTSDKAIDVGGMYLTDDLAQPTMWQIPANRPAATTIPAGGYLLVWADNEVADTGLHTNFQLNADGEQIGLFAADGHTLIDSIMFADQAADISFGCYPDGSDNLRFLGLPSPAGQNNGAYLGQVADTKFSHDRGFYDQPFEVTITCETPDAVIYYTVDGTQPYQTGGRFPTGKVYTGPIRIGTTTCLRAVAIKHGWMSSNVDTQTYIFLANVIRQPANPGGFPSTWGSESADYEMDPDIVNAHINTIKDDLKSLPTMSLVMDLKHLFDSKDGIYSHPQSSGVTWERPGSIEMIYPPDVRRIYPDGSKGFQANCGVRIYGGVGRREKKRSLRLMFKGIYGPTRLRYPLFGEDAADEFDCLILRANFNDGYPFGKACSQYIRDEFCRRLQLALGHPSPHGIFVHLYVNGLYWGLYNPVERPESSFAATYFGGDKEDWDALNSGRPVGDSTTVTYNAMLNVVRQGLQTNEAYQRLQGNNPDGTPNPNYVDYLDIENYIDYMIVNLYVGNTDWPGHNWYAAFNRVNPTGWKSFSWDAEWVVGLIVGHGLDSSLNENMTGVSSSLCEPYARLRSNSEFRLLFADHVHRAFFNGGLMYVDRNNPQWNPAHPERNRPAALYAELAEAVERAMIAESARWGDVGSSAPYTVEQWRAQRDQILYTYMPQRSQIVLDQLRSASLYPSVDAPVFNINGSYQHGGRIAATDLLSMTAAGDIIYYTLDGSDPRWAAGSQSAVSSSSTLLVSEDAAKRVLVPSGPVSDNWKGGGTFDDSAWISGTGGVGYEASSGYEALIKIDLREQMYNGNTSCYIRIPFALTSAQLSGLNLMTLEVRYDDGFVAYVNGTEVARRNFTGEPAWNSQASGGNPDSAAAMLESVGISEYINILRPGSNILAIHGLNTPSSSSDFLISVRLTAGKSPDSIVVGGASPTAIKYTGPITLTRSTHVKARVLSGSTWSAFNEATFAVGPVAENLRITEIMYHPPDTDSPSDANEEFIELKNTCPEPVEGVGSQTINLNLVHFTNGIDFTFPIIELAAGGYVLVVKDQAAFYARYPDFAGIIAGQYAGSLANEGERIRLEDAIGQTIMDFRYSDAWRDITDGRGFSLTIVNPANPDVNSWGQKDSWRASAFYGGSPGWDDTGIIPEPGSVVINEVLAHSHADSSDWIELYNTTGEAINIGGWFLSDDGNDPSAEFTLSAAEGLGTGLTKYQIADGTVIAANSYIVFYQDQHFGNLADPGCHRAFALSENGDQVYLSSAQDGVLTGYQEVEDFGASQTGVSFGRYYKGSTDNYNFVAMSQNTPGAANAYPKVGPIVINEIMYNPGSGNQDEEYIELHNITAEPVTLYDYMTSQPWRFTDGIEYVFPSSPAVTIPAGGYLLVVKHLDSFVARYGLPLRLASQDAAAGAVPAPAGSFRTETNLEGPAGVVVVGPYDGQLKNGGEKLELSMPGDVDALGQRYYIRVDRVNFSDGLHPEDQPGGVDLWPVEADGAGLSLSRKVSSAYGNDVVNWKAASPSPGRANP